MDIRVGGEDVYVYTAGKPLAAELPAVVFVHGAQLDHSSWVSHCRWFANHGHCALAIDLPGHGRSGGPPLASIGAISDWLMALFDAAGLARAALVGHSMGSLAALEAAATHADRVSAIALVGNATPMPVSEALLAAAKNDEGLAERMINLWQHSARAQMGASPVPGMWMMGLGLRLMERARPGVLYNDLSACNDYRRGLERAAGLKCPALIISGGSDQMTPAKATEAIAAALPRGRRVVLPGVGHALMAEHPDGVLDELIAFLAG